MGWLMQGKLVEVTPGAVQRSEQATLGPWASSKSVERFSGTSNAAEGIYAHWTAVPTKHTTGQQCRPSTRLDSSADQAHDWAAVPTKPAVESQTRIKTWFEARQHRYERATVTGEEFEQDWLVPRWEL
ncbi:hypothetical protein E2P81_ATG06706 [Venturia nashicola]|nr:hypothetical protein E2P81_ATG06706 [Venturia nashicola]